MLPQIHMREPQLLHSVTVEIGFLIYPSFQEVLIEVEGGQEGRPHSDLPGVLTGRGRDASGAPCRGGATSGLGEEVVVRGPGRASPGAHRCTRVPDSQAPRL